MYAIVDLETTGGSRGDHRITEIAIFKHDGEKIVDQYHSLVNPERSIPAPITRLTGITDEMVRSAPRFFQIAKEIVEFTEGTVFVAHNVGFDYGFLKKEFSFLGYKYQRKKLCTVRLARRMLPGFASYSLGNLCESLGIEVKARHRAHGDAEATVKLFSMLLSKISKSSSHEFLMDEEISLIEYPPHLERDCVYELKNEVGVYRFIDRSDRSLYIGKSKEIRKRVLSHFQSQDGAKKAMKLRHQLKRIEAECLGFECLAEIVEDQKIKKEKPLLNRKGRQSKVLFGISLESNLFGECSLKVKALKFCEDPLLRFHSRKAAEKALQNIEEKYQIHKLGDRGMKSSLFEELKKKYRYPFQEFLFVGPGRESEELAILLVGDGVYQGYGFFNLSEISGFFSFHELFDYVHRSLNFQEEYEDSRRILLKWIRRKTDGSLDQGFLIHEENWEGLVYLCQNRRT
jgi:DNA polymerase-3 subunit epsilon